jgi:hypothetical protein
VVLTEAGSGFYSLTPALAALGGATRVIAVTRDSIHGPGERNARAALGFAACAGVHGRIEVVNEVSRRWLAESDIVTNLGFVRPIDAAAIAAMKPTAVIPLMCESWEVRVEDVDLAACERHGVVAMGTNEDHPLVGVFEYCGILALAMLLEAGFEVLGTRVVVVGRDRFAPVIAGALERAGAQVRTVQSLDPSALLEQASGGEVLLVADYGDDTMVIDDTGAVRAGDIANVRPGIAIIQFAGGIDAASVRAAGLPLWPAAPVPPRRMSRTLAALGPRPVLALHAAGLKVAELCARARLRGLTPGDTVAAVSRLSGIPQPVP